jgi:hypothetical protein
MASGYPVEAIFESGNIAGDVLAHLLGRLETVKIRFAPLFP